MKSDAVDFAELAAIVGNNNPALLEEVLNIWQETSGENLTLLHAAAEKRDRSLLGEAAHAAKGAARQIGARILGDMINRLEGSAPHLSWKEIDNLIEDIDSENNRVEHAVLNYIQKLKA